MEIKEPFSAKEVHNVKSLSFNEHGAFITYQKSDADGKGLTTGEKETEEPIIKSKKLIYFTMSFEKSGRVKIVNALCEN